MNNYFLAIAKMTQKIYILQQNMVNILFYHDHRNINSNKNFHPSNWKN